MAEFCPGCDYFRLNATATSFVSYDDHYPSNSSSIAAPSRPDISPTCAASTAYVNTEQITTSPDKLVDELKVLQMSRVYQQNLSKMRRRRWRPIKHCVFCRNNLEPEAVYNSHTLKDFQQKITCPILRAYTCPICGATGDGAHTIKYCPYKAQQPQTPSPPLQLSWISSPLSPIT